MEFKMWVVIFVCVFTKLADSTERILEAEEPQCYSRFDYEYKVLQHLVSLKEAEKELRDVTDELQSKVKDLEEKVKDPVVVAFSVQLSNRVDNGEQLSIIRFEHVLTNIGNGYDVNSGIFIAPVPGLYSFSAELASPAAGRLYIMFNGTNVAYLFVNGVGWQSCSETVSLKLHFGDKVWISGRGRAEGYADHNCGDANCYHSSFTGVLVQTYV